MVVFEAVASVETCMILAAANLTEFPGEPDGAAAVKVAFELEAVASVEAGFCRTVGFGDAVVSRPT